MPGKVDLERCPICRVPRRVGSCHWDLNAGIITDPEAGRRRAIFVPAGMEAVLEDPEAELGGAIPEAVIKAQRKYTLNTIRRMELKGGRESFREMIAVRGLGLLEELRFDGEGLSVLLRNTCVPLLMVGLFQGAYEVISGCRKSSVRWKISGGGDLVVTITAS